MAIKTVTIGGLEDVLQFDDGDFDYAVESESPISVGGIETGAMPAALPAIGDLIVFRDISNGNKLTTCTMAQLQTLIC